MLKKLSCRAMGMNCDGVTSPNCGCDQRISASTPHARPVALIGRERGAVLVEARDSPAHGGRKGDGRGERKEDSCGRIQPRATQAGEVARVALDRQQTVVHRVPEKGAGERARQHGGDSGIAAAQFAFHQRPSLFRGLPVSSRIG